MLKKLSLACVALLAGTSAFAQQTITTNYTSPVTITTANGCTITGIRTLNYDGAGAITVDGSGSCGGTNPPPTNSVASVTLSINPTSYTLGSNAAAPVINVTNNTAAAQVSCTLNPTNGFSVTAGSPVTNSGTFALSAPTTAGTFSFTPVCTTTTPGYTVSVSPQTLALAVVAAPPPTGPSACSASQTATIGTKSLQRQCSGTMNVWPGPLAGYGGALEDLGTVMGGSSFPTFGYAGYSPTFSIQSGYYVSLAFTPKASGAIQFSANPSYGDGGIISLSTVPGAITQGSAGAICALTRGGNNSLYVSTTSGSICQVQQGTTYYINFADVDSTGNNLCYGSRANTCQNSLVSYTIYTSQ